MKVKKAIIILLSAAMALSALAGCQATPEAPIVVQKDMEQMIEKAQETSDPGALSLREKTQAPQMLQYELVKEKVTVHMNAPVTVSSGNVMCILRVKPGGFSQEQVSALWRELVGETEMFRASQEMTKTEIEAAIIAAKAYIENTDDAEMKAYQQSMLDHFNSIYDSAPAERTRMSVDGTLQTLYFTQYGSNKKTEYLGIWGESADGTLRFTLNNADLEGTHEAEFTFDGSLNSIAEGQPTVEKQEVDIDDKTAPKDAAGLNLSPYEAAQKVNAFFSNVGLPFAPAYATLDKEDRGCYYTFFCTRNVGDIPMTFVLGTPFTADEEDNYAPAWSYESFSVTVDDAGIRKVNWRVPIEIVENVVDDSSLMPFSDIQAIFDRMMFVTYGYQARDGKTLVCDISEVRLETMRITEQNSGIVGLLVPVWNFYGTRTREYEGGSVDTTSKISLLCVNAIDGSVIDVSKGY